MKLTSALLAAIAIPLALGACSKPADPAAEPMSADAAPGSTADQGGAVSGPQANGAVNTDGNVDNMAVAPASNSFTEEQAKGHFETAGYTDVTNLTKTADGLWTASAMQAGKPVNVALDFKGAVTTR